MDGINAKLDRVLSELESIKTKLAEVREVKKLVEKLSALPGRVETLEEDYFEITKEMDEYWEENCKTAARLDDLEQYSRLNNVIISGVPYSKDERVRDLVKTVAQGLKIEVDDRDLDIVHRLPSKFEVPTIIAKFNNREMKNAMARAAKKIKLNGAIFHWKPSIPIFVMTT